MDENDNQPQPSYFEYIVTHMLHRIWELQATALMLQAQTDEDKQALQQVIDAQRQSDYITPMEW